MTERLWLCLLLAACRGPTLTIAERRPDAAVIDAAAIDAGADGGGARDDDDDQSDELVIPCASDTTCSDPREPERRLCDVARGSCVECLRDADCPAGERCDEDGECDD